jgi:hypothetical protein
MIILIVERRPNSAFTDGQRQTQGCVRDNLDAASRADSQVQHEQRLTGKQACANLDGPATKDGGLQGTGVIVQIEVG